MLDNDLAHGDDDGVHVRQHERWDVLSSVGFTALMVAAARAVETSSGTGMVDDQWAHRFVTAAAAPAPVPTDPSSRWPRPAGLAPEVDAGVDEFWALLVAYLAVRSRFFDEVLTAVSQRGIDQVVLLAAGLDARAYRLPWANGTVIYEVDQGAVMEFKDGVLLRHGARPSGDRRVVPADLREDWVSALKTAGFDPGRPSAWLAEGLLPFLPAEAELDLFARIDQLAAPGSFAAVEDFARFFHHSIVEPIRKTALTEYGALFGLDIWDVVSMQPRAAARSRLTELGWTATATSSARLAKRYGRPLPPFATGLAMDSELVTATKGEPVTRRT